jgi:transcriptional regulator with XRE-family HTH domain
MNTELLISQICKLATAWSDLSPKIQHAYLHNHPLSKRKLNSHFYHDVSPLTKPPAFPNIRYQRKSLNLTSQDLALLIDSNENDISALERGHTLPFIIDWNPHDELIAHQSNINPTTITLDQYNSLIKNPNFNSPPIDFTQLAKKLADFFELPPEQLFDIQLTHSTDFNPGPEQNILSKLTNKKLFNILTSHLSPQQKLTLNTYLNLNDISQTAKKLNISTTQLHKQLNIILDSIRKPYNPH